MAMYTVPPNVNSSDDREPYIYRCIAAMAVLSTLQ